MLLQTAQGAVLKPAPPLPLESPSQGPLAGWPALGSPHLTPSSCTGATPT